MLYISSPILPISNCTDIVSSPDKHDTFISAYAHTVDYINGTRTNITVIERNGIKITIPPSGLIDVRGFIVRSTFKFNESVNFDADGLLNDVTENSSIELRQLRDAMINGLRTKVYGHYVISIDYNIEPNDLLESGGTMYYSNLDLVVSVRDIAHVPPHPYSEEGRKLKMLTEDDDINSVGSFGYKLKIIDNGGNFNARWVNIAGRPFRIPAIKDPTLTDGVYLTSTGASIGAPPKIEMFTFDEAAEKLHLYKSKEEAEALGDLFLQRERELKERELSFKEFENDYKLRRQEMQTTIDAREQSFKLKELEYDEKLARLNHIRDEIEHQRKLEEIRKKDYYENRSYERKDSSEILKYAPVVVAGVFALFAALRG